MCCQTFAQQCRPGTLNRMAIVRRHNITIRNTGEPGPSQVGNGNIAYGFDITGMQTFSDKFTTMSQWSWHSRQLPDWMSVADFKKTKQLTNGRMVEYDLPNPEQPALSRWLASNPHRFNLGRIGLWLQKKDGTLAIKKDLDSTVQYVDLWTNVVESHFILEGESVTVTTVGDPAKDIIAFKIKSPLIAEGRLGILIEFPYPDADEFSTGGDYTKPGLHTTLFQPVTSNTISFYRRLDNTNYHVLTQWSGSGTIVKKEPHQFLLKPSGSKTVEYVFSFSIKKIIEPLPAFAQVLENSKKYWPSFWKSGAAIDLSQSKDPRWMELERRVVLSQYLMKINASGNYPPQETGLVNNSWFGRFHFEMIWWHVAHYALWERWPLLNNCLHVYNDNLAGAISRAKEQGYKGARFPKCTGPGGREWPHPIHAYLVWQQPHPIFFANLDYRAHPSAGTIRKWLPVINGSADFLASFLQRDSLTGQYNLGTPIAFAPENNNYYQDKNPAF
jgi:hypothetical protein